MAIATHGIEHGYPSKRFHCALQGFAIILCLGLSIGILHPARTALAEDIPTEYDVSEFQAEVERTAVEYEAALSEVESAEAAVDESSNRIAELETMLPAQQARSASAARELYKIHKQTPGLIDLLLEVSSFEQFLGNIEYMGRVTQANYDELARLSTLKDELSNEYAELREARDKAAAIADEAKTALEAATAAREEAQRRAAEEAAARALEEQARLAAEAQKQASASSGSNASGKSGGNSKDVDDGSASQGQNPNAAEDEKSGTEGASSQDSTAEQAEAIAEEPMTSEVGPVNDGADWSSEEASFISSWGARIDAYLAGSPLAGQGATFAKAAWTYGVDPRWSPAISCIESGKGAECFNSHNAWGWGSASWDNWEEAINDHVKGLARGYGYTITVDAAKTYCPPNWKHWYEATSKEMNLI